MILIKTNFLHEKSEGVGVSWGLVVQEVSGENRSGTRSRAAAGAPGQDQGTGRKSLHFCTENTFKALTFPDDH